MLIRRTITAASVLLSVPAHMGLIDFSLLLFAPSLILTFRRIPQLWRVVTTFLLTGPKLGMILDPYFLYKYGSALETTAVRFSGPGDFFVYLVFVCTIILVSRPLISTYIALHAAQLFPCLAHKTSYICPSSTILAVTVPGNEGDYPRAVHSPIIRIILKGVRGVRARWDS